MDQGALENLIAAPGKWQECEPFHLKFEKWNKLEHSRPLYSKGYGGWISIKNFWSKQTFEAIEAYSRGLEGIALETLNLPNVSKAKIQVKKNLCGFLPSSSIEITDTKRGNTFLNLEILSNLILLRKLKAYYS